MPRPPSVRASDTAREPARTVLTSPTSLAAFAAIYLIWGTTFLAVELGLRAFAPFQLMGIRSLIGGSLLLGGLSLAGRADWRSEWGIAARSGLLLFVGGHGLGAYAQQEVASWLAAVMFATVPFWMALLNPRQLGQGAARASRLLALLVGFGGIVVIGRADAADGEGSSIRGMLILAVAAACWALGSTVALRRPNPGMAAALTGKQLLCGGTALVLVSLARGESWHPSGPLAWDAIAGLAWLVVMGSLVALVACQWLLDRLPATLVTTYTFVNPAVAVVVGWLVLDERPAPAAWAGIALVIGAVAASLAAQRWLLPAQAPAPQRALRSAN